MADSKISNLTAGTVAAVDSFPFVQSGTTKVDTIQGIIDLNPNLATADQTLADAARNITLAGDLSSDKLVIENSSGTDIITFAGDDVVTIPTGQLNVTGSSSYGVFVNGGNTTANIRGNNTAVNGVGVQGSCSATTGTNVGVYGISSGVGATTNIGVRADASGATNNYAIRVTAGDIKFSQATQNMTLNGATSSDKLNFTNGTNDALTIEGAGRVYSYGRGFVTSNTAFGKCFSNTTPTGTNNTAFGNSAMANLTSGGSNTAVGSSALSSLSSGYSNMALGYKALQYIATSNSNVGIGTDAGKFINAGTNNTGTSTSIFIGFDARPAGATDVNTIVIGSSARGNGSNSTTIGTTSTTENYIYGNFNITDADDIVIGTTTGTKIGTATSQKIGFWNATPIIQPTTGVAAATFAANTSGIADDTATFDSYTIGQVVKALRNTGILA